MQSSIYFKNRSYCEHTCTLEKYDTQIFEQPVYGHTHAKDDGLKAIDRNNLTHHFPDV